MLSRQRYKCKSCAYFFTVNNQGRARHIKRHAIYLYLEGKGLRAIGRMLGVSNVAVMKWVRKYVGETQILRNNPRHVDQIHYDEIEEFIKKRRTLVDSGWLIIGIDENNPVTCWISNKKKF
ncbi:MAG: IS1 family transposase [Bacteroidetes bacterium]|nr:IS1 family transposase [Bacteroidota bacterium]